MKLTDITLPGGYTIKNPDSFSPVIKDLGSLISQILNLIFYLSGFILLGFLLWGAFEYLISQGNKEKLAKAKAKITWALVGYVIIILAFAISTYIQTVLCPPSSSPNPIPNPICSPVLTIVGGT